MTVAPQAAVGTMSAQSLNQANCRLVDLDTGRFISCLCAYLDLAHRRAVLPTPTRVRLPPHGRRRLGTHGAFHRWVGREAATGRDGQRDLREGSAVSGCAYPSICLVRIRFL